MKTQSAIDVVVTDVVTVNSLIKRFHFARPDGQPLPAFSGGAHIIIEMHDGDTVRRTPYSLMSSPAETGDYQVSIRRDDEGRGGSLFMHNKVSKGMTMRISYPANLFSLDKRAPKQLLIAGGIGITPFLAQIKQMLGTNSVFELHYSARNAELAAYVPELRQAIDHRLHVYYDDQAQRIPFDTLLSSQPPGTHVYVCGPAPMIEHILTRAKTIGWPDTHVHSEHFAKAPPGEAFTVHLQQSNKTIEVAENQSMLEAIEAAGVDAPYLCRGGACGHCETAVMQCNGILLHEDHWLDEDERARGNKVMPCVSRFQGERLVLDR